jgi:hypothetical protein
MCRLYLAFKPVSANLTSNILLPIEETVLIGINRFLKAGGEMNHG